MSPSRKRRPRRRRGRPAQQDSKPPSRDIRGAREVARRAFGIRQLRPEQEQVMEAVLAGRDALAVLPTGFGKSLTYQVPAQLHDRPTLVVSPLIALMIDQESALASRNLPVVRLDGTLLVAERRSAVERIREGGRLVVLTTPETLENPETRKLLRAAKPWLLCVDEAHCISEWGHDFRPAYLRLASARRALGGPVVLGLTATATPHVRADVAERLKMLDPLVVAAPPHRSNLILGVELVTGMDKHARTGRLLKKLRRPGIVYCATTVAVDQIHTALTRARFPVVRYHGRMAKAEREAQQRLFLRPARPKIMVATTAFGMGIDKPDIRFVLHYQCPGSLEQYVQEAGRAGRDGKPSRCTLLYDPEDLRIQRHLQSGSRTSTTQLRRVVDALRAWAGEEREVSSADLALSAGVPRTVARSTCAQLEELGIVEEESRRWTVTVSERQLVLRSRDLLRRLETQRLQDDERLKTLDEYAQSGECRSVLIRRYFGEDDPPECGTCDVCRALVAAGRRPQRRASGERRKKKRPRRRKKTVAEQGERSRRKRPRRKRRKKPE